MRTSGQQCELLDHIGQIHQPVVPGRDGVRIVSLVPSITELLFDLGLGDHIVGRTGFCVHPKSRVKVVPKVGGTKDVHLDKVRELRPSHVIVNVDENTRETYEHLVQFAPNVIVTHPCSPADNVELYRLLAGIFRVERAADKLATSLEQELRACTASREPEALRVLYLIWREPWMTVSADTYIARMLDLVGWQALPISSDARYPVVSPEQCGSAVDYVLLSTEPYAFREKHIEEASHVFGAPASLIDGEYLSWYGSRAIQGVRYLREFAAALPRAARS